MKSGEGVCSTSVVRHRTCTPVEVAGRLERASSSDRQSVFVSCARLNALRPLAIAAVKVVCPGVKLML
ncbi:hypothetical protein LSTR_LSTR010287 [Laodelphax striatellus]|uniref:Uncharacterized protein n=1 Tax=Laodelphax striatellus TaxID=195883 RepID=A0A482XRL4_LAOST|nr:hypothetical protein LSTR_LSTR010287 [Laodelphax striatellus]